MRVYLMRHAPAEARDARRYPDDTLRPLSTKGRRRHKRVARRLKALKLKPKYILTSPRRRALDTASITAAALGVKRPPIETDLLGDGFKGDALLREIERRHGDLLLVGHEPDLGRFAAALLGTPGAIPFKKSGVMGLDLGATPRRGRACLLFFYRPADLLR